MKADELSCLVKLSTSDAEYQAVAQRFTPGNIQSVGGNGQNLWILYQPVTVYSATFDESLNIVTVFYDLLLKKTPVFCLYVSPD